MQGDRRYKYMRRRKAGSIKWLMKILITILILLSAYFFVHSSFFAVTSIQVTGTKLVTGAEIAALSGLAKGVNIFKVDRAEAEKKISMNSMVASVEVERHFPRRIEIIVRERVPIALVPIDGGLMQIDVEGFILKKDSKLSKEPMPIITGLDFPDTLAVGKKLDSKKLAMGLKMIAQMDSGAKKEIAEVDVFDPQKLRAFTVQGAEVRLGNGDNFTEKFGKFLQVLKEEQKLDRLKDIEYIDVSFSGKPVVFYRK